MVVAVTLLRKATCIALKPYETPYNTHAHLPFLKPQFGLLHLAFRCTAESREKRGLPNAQQPRDQEGPGDQQP